MDKAFFHNAHWNIYKHDGIHRYREWGIRLFRDLNGFYALSIYYGRCALTIQLLKGEENGKDKQIP